jgi:CSLREA domain-containing protein
MAWKWGAALGGLITACVLALPAIAGAATIKVTTHTDELDGTPDSTCSLREAVQSANSNTAFGGCHKGGGHSDTITLDGGHYALTIPTTSENLNANGDLDVDGDKVIFQGEGAGQSDIRTSLADRVVDVHNATTVTFQDIQIQGGDVTSLGSGNGRGGGIRADEGGVLTLSRATVYDNKAYIGGGLYMNGPVGQPGTLKVKRSLFITNHATGIGGAIDTAGDTTAKISKNIIYENTVQDDTDAAEAGGISNRGTKMTITDTEFSGNAAMGDTGEAAYGGALSNYTGAELTVRRSLFEFNSASAPTVAIFEAAGAIYVANGSDTVTITNTTFYENTVGAPDGQGAAITVNGGTVVLANATVSGQSSAPILHASGGYLLVRNSIIEGSNPCTGAFIDSGSYNVTSIDDPECDSHAEDVTDAPSFGFKTTEPTQNGGQTRTIALKKSSPAINLIPKDFCGITNREDQRGFKRPKRKCDAGAYERGAKKP